jgi:hypothetical protein
MNMAHSRVDCRLQMTCWDSRYASMCPYNPTEVATCGGRHGMCLVDRRYARNSSQDKWITAVSLGYAMSYDTHFWSWIYVYGDSIALVYLTLTFFLQGHNNKHLIPIHGSPNKSQYKAANLASWWMRYLIILLFHPWLQKPVWAGGWAHPTRWCKHSSELNQKKGCRLLMFHIYVFIRKKHEDLKDRIGVVHRRRICILVSRRCPLWF